MSMDIKDLYDYYKPATANDLMKAFFEGGIYQIWTADIHVTHGFEPNVFTADPLEIEECANAMFEIE